MKQISDINKSITSPFGPLGRRILKKTNPEFEAKTSDIFGGYAAARETHRALGMESVILEEQRKPEILTDEYKQNKKQRALVASVRQNSIDTE